MFLRCELYVPPDHSRSIPWLDNLSRNTFGFMASDNVFTCVCLTRNLRLSRMPLIVLGAASKLSRNVTKSSQNVHSGTSSSGTFDSNSIN